PDRALKRRNLVLLMMRENGRLTDAEYRAEMKMPLRPSTPAAELAAASPSCGRYYQEEVRRQLVSHFGGRRMLRGGLRVYTAYDPAMQCAAEHSIGTRIAQIAK